MMIREMFADDINRKINGVIKVESKVGEGSNFIVKLFNE